MASPGFTLFFIPSNPAIKSAEKHKYGFEDGSGKRASTRLAFGDSVHGIRTQPDLFLAEYARSTGASNPGIKRL